LDQRKTKSVRPGRGLNNLIKMTRKRGHVAVQVNPDLLEHLKKLESPGAWVGVELTHVKKK
jgi:hypothetical protein